VAKKCFVANQKMKNETNFFCLLRIHNISNDNELQQKMNNGHLAKTKPIKHGSKPQRWTLDAGLSTHNANQKMSNKTNFRRVKNEHKLRLNKGLR